MKKTFKHIILVFIGLFVFAITNMEITLAQSTVLPDTSYMINETQIGDPGQIPPPPGIGNGDNVQQIGGDGQIPTPPNPGGGSGSQQIGGSGSQLPEPPNPGGGNGIQPIGGGDTIPEPPNPGGGGGLPMGTVLQSITIPAGWSGISSQVIPHNANLDSLFELETAASNLVIMQHFSRFYWPAYQINTIGNWKTHDGYTIKVLQPTQLDLYGFNDQNDTIQFSTGWNYLPVISDCDVATVGLFADLVANGQLIIAFEIAGTHLYAPIFGINSLPVLKRGKAYLVKVTGPCSVSFPDCFERKSNNISINQTIIKTPWAVAAETPKQYFMFITDTTSSVIQPGDVIGGFTENGICCGVTENLNPKMNNALVLFGDDPTTIIKDGFNNEEEIIIKRYRPSTGVTIRLNITCQGKAASTKERFVVNSFSVIQKIESKSQD